MKARDYADLLNTLVIHDRKTPEQAIIEILSGFIGEAEELLETRHASTDSACAAVYREMSEKWRAFARLAPGVRPEGFYNAVMSAMTKHPDLIAALKKNGFTR